MTRASDAYAALIRAVETTCPPCRGDDRYLSDHGPIPEDMAAMCATCPVMDLCCAYALADRPQAGVWAGERWDKPRRPGRPSKRKEVA